MEEMKVHPLLTTLILVSGLLLGVFLGRWSREKVQTTAHAMEPSPSTVREVTHPPKDSARFQWSSIETTNYFKYIRNLRDIGCPSDTICVIIKSELDKLFAERWQQSQKANSENYWEANPPAWIVRNREKAQRARYESEKAALLRQLLGVTGSCGCDENHPGSTQGLFTSQDKGTKVDIILAQYEMSEKDLDLELNTTSDKAALMQARLKLLEQKRQALLEVISPQELRDLELAISPRATYLRERLYGFQPTRDEFESIYNYYGGKQDIYVATQSSELSQEATKAREEALNDTLRSALGETRFKEYLLQNNGDYHALAMMGQLKNWDSQILSSALLVLQENIETDIAGDASRIRNIKTKRDDQLRTILGDERFKLFIEERRPDTRMWPLPGQPSLWNRPIRTGAINPILQYW